MQDAKIIAQTAHFDLNSVFLQKYASEMYLFPNQSVSI